MAMFITKALYFHFHIKLKDPRDQRGKCVLLVYKSVFGLPLNNDKHKTSKMLTSFLWLSTNVHLLLMMSINNKKQLTIPSR